MKRTALLPSLSLEPATELNCEHFGHVDLAVCGFVVCFHSIKKIVK